MKPTILSLIILVSAAFSVQSFGQATDLIPGKTIERQILKGEDQLYAVTLKNGEHLEFTIKPTSVIVTIQNMDSLGRSSKMVQTVSPVDGSILVSIDALKTGRIGIKLYPSKPPLGLKDEEKSEWLDENQGNYVITEIIKLTAGEYKQKLAKIQEDKNAFTQWIKNNAHEIKIVDAGNGFEDLQNLKTILKDVRVVGLGEATHGTSEFFRMKHRMLEFLVKEMGFTVFFIEDNWQDCIPVNDFVLRGIGDLDSVAMKLGTSVWHVEEIKNLIKWIRFYNSTVPEGKKVKFMGMDNQRASLGGWKRLKDFYRKVNSSELSDLDSVQLRMQAAMKIAFRPPVNSEGAAYIKAAFFECLRVLNDMVLNEGKYRSLSDNYSYDENMMNIKLIVQQIQSCHDKNISVRDYYMAENILFLLNQEGPDVKAAVWAHNAHIAKDSYPFINPAMGNYLGTVLKKGYYAIGFEFYRGSIRALAPDRKSFFNPTIEIPPEESLPGYFNRIGLEKFFIDFKTTNTDDVRNISLPYEMHYIGHSFTAKTRSTTALSLKNYDGMIYIKESTPAKDLTRGTPSVVK